MLKVAHFELENALHFASTTMDGDHIHVHVHIYISICFHFCFLLFPQFTPQPQRLIELVRVLSCPEF